MKKLLAILFLAMTFISCVEQREFPIVERCYQGTVYVFGTRGHQGFMSPKFVNNKTVNCNEFSVDKNVK